MCRSDTGEPAHAYLERSVPSAIMGMKGPGIRPNLSDRTQRRRQLHRDFRRPGTAKHGQPQDVKTGIRIPERLCVARIPVRIFRERATPSGGSVPSHQWTNGCPEEFPSPGTAPRYSGLRRRNSQAQPFRVRNGTRGRIGRGHDMSPPRLVASRIRRRKAAGLRDTQSFDLRGRCRREDGCPEHRSRNTARPANT